MVMTELFFNISYTDASDNDGEKDILTFPCNFEKQSKTQQSLVEAPRNVYFRSFVWFINMTLTKTKPNLIISIIFSRVTALSR